MIDPFDLWNSFQSANNTFAGGWFRPQTDFIQACNDISKELWNKYRKESEKSQEARDNMLPFIKTKNFIVKNKGIYGRFTPDTDYGGFSGARIRIYKDKCLPDPKADNGKDVDKNCFITDSEMTEDYLDNVKEYDVELIDDIKWGAVNRHKTKGPTFEKPKMRQVDGGFEVLPRSVSVIVLDYYRQPKTATFLYTPAPGNVQTGAGDQIIYNTESQPLEWPFNLRDEFIIRLGERYSLFTREQFLYAASQQSKNNP
jgi:hypothetical protein